MHERESIEHVEGVSLVGLLLMVVVLGVMTATAVIGLQSITGGTNGGTAPGAPAAIASSKLAGRMSNVGNGGIGGVPVGITCTAAADAARSVSALYFAVGGGKSYPTRWSDLTTSSPPIYKLARNVVINAANPRELDGQGWKLMMIGGGAAAPTFTCA